MLNWLHLQVENVTTLPGTSTVILSLGEDEAKHPIEMYLHKKYYRLLDEHVLVWRFAQLLVSFNGLAPNRLSQTQALAQPTSIALRMTVMAAAGWCNVAHDGVSPC
jgi:hypothetical protein